MSAETINCLIYIVSNAELESLALPFIPWSCPIHSLPHLHALSLPSTAPETHPHSPGGSGNSQAVEHGLYNGADSTWAHARLPPVLDLQ